MCLKPYKSWYNKQNYFKAQAMKLNLIFVGNIFIYNPSFKEYILREVEKQGLFADSVTHFKESDNSLFLDMEREINGDIKTSMLMVITTKQIFSTLGKVICTITGDNLVLQDSLLLPQKSSIFSQDTYLLEYKNTILNVMQVEIGKKLPDILLKDGRSSGIFHIFEEQQDSISMMLSPIAQTYNINFIVTKQIEGWHRVDFSSNKYGDIAKFIEASKKLLPKKLIATTNVIEYIIERLSSLGKKISFAESCTGGLLSYYFTKNNGASKILDGSLVTYSNALKENWLAVSHQTLKQNGAVSSEVVDEMSDGVLNVSNADYAISISGIAGDSGGTKEKPVGTVYVGIRSKEKHIHQRLHLDGDRNYIQYQSVLYGIKLLVLIDKEAFF